MSRVSIRLLKGGYPVVRDTLAHFLCLLARQEGVQKLDGVLGDLLGRALAVGHLHRGVLQDGGHLFLGGQAEVVGEVWMMSTLSLATPSSRPSSAHTFWPTLVGGTLRTLVSILAASASL